MTLPHAVFKAVGMGVGSMPFCMVFDPELGRILPHDASFGYFNSPAVEAVAIFFMTTTKQ